MNRRRVTVIGLLTLLAALLSSLYAGAQTDPLPSWNDGPAKPLIVKFVHAVTDPASPDYVPAEQRIATFDNDGTLWIEQPMYVQLAFALDRVKVLAPTHPQWRQQQPFKAVLDGNTKALAASGDRGLLQLIATTHAGMTTEQVDTIVRACSPRHGILVSSARIPTSCTSPSSRCSRTCARAASRRTSSPEGASISCAQPAIDAPGQQGADEGANPEQPQLRQRPAADEDCGPGAARGIHRRVRSREC